MKKTFLLLLMTIVSMVTANEQPRLLIKIPTRGRPEQFFNTLNTYYHNLSRTIPYHIHISCDCDDDTMCNMSTLNKLNLYENLTVSFENNKSKVEAYNNLLSEYVKDGYNLLLLGSDDKKIVVKEYDVILVSSFQEAFPDYDGILNITLEQHDTTLNTLPVVGKTYYKRFGYVFNPTYRSFFADNELALVSKILKREKIVDMTIYQHHHPAYGLGNWDATYGKSQNSWEHDEQQFNQRRSQLFDISDNDLARVYRKKWSLLIPTLTSRRSLFERMYSNLTQQIEQENLENQVEVVVFEDQGQYSIGYKRNELLRRSCGEYVNFLDDDDIVADDYIKTIYGKLQNSPDCVSLKGIKTTDGKDPHLFVHSVAYDHYFEQDGIFYRPPNHLNTMKRAYAVQLEFPEINYGEDYDWANELAGIKLLRTEETIEKPYYFYLYRSGK